MGKGTYRKGIHYSEGPLFESMLRRKHMPDRMTKHNIYTSIGWSQMLMDEQIKLPITTIVICL